MKQFVTKTTYDYAHKNIDLIGKIKKQISDPKLNYVLLIEKGRDKKFAVNRKF